MTRARFHSIIRRLIASLGLCHWLLTLPDAAAELTPAPASFVQDDARLFDAAAVETMSRALAETERASGVWVYVATSSYQETAGSRNHEQSLVDQWLNDKPGMILTYNRGDGRTEVVPSPELWRRHPADEIARLLAEAGRVLARPGASPEQRIQDTVALIAGRFQHLAASPRAPQGLLTTVERKLAISVAATVALAVLAGWLGACLRRRNAAALGGPFWFPEATVKSRLGGQFGGSIGEASTRRPD